MKRFKRPAALFALLLVLSFFVGCAADDSSSAGDSDGGGGGSMDIAGTEGVSEEEARGLAFDADTAASGGLDDFGGVGNASSDLPPIGPAVIKTASLNLEVEGDDFNSSVQDAVDIAKRHGGFVLTTELGGGDSKRGSVVVRVPAEQFESALGELKGLGDVKRESISGQDVTQEFVDLSARLRNFEAQESVLLGLMEKASTVSASIRVQRELSSVQLEIERLRGRINYLDDQTSFSTITVDMREAGAAPPKPAGTIGRAWEQAKDTFMAVISATIIGAGFVIPIALLLVIAGLVYRLAVKPRLPAAN
jgi:hypothetical protein